MRFLISLFTLYLLVLLSMQQWKRTCYVGDAFGYYSYLPAGLIYRDLGDFEKTVPVWRSYVGAPPEDVRKSSMFKTETGRYSIIYPPGVALLQLPFFAAAHVWCVVTGQFPADGLSLPYMLLAAFSTLFYVFWGFWMLYRTLLRFYSERVVLYALATLAIATHLFFFAAYRPGMAHPYLFALFCGLLYATVRWYEAPSPARSVVLGSFVGAIALCRAPDVVAAALFPLLWGGWTAEKRRFLRTHLTHAAIAVGAAFVVFLPQLLYWRWSSGQWFYYSYQGMGFTWSEPRLKGGFFSYRNGWLVYTPVMAFAIAGLFWLKNKIKEAVLPVFTIFILHVYIIYSWWCWYYLNGLGSRPMIDIYPLLALPLAAFFSWSLSTRWSTWVTTLAIAFFSWLNLVYTWQTHEGILLSELTKKNYFWYIFGKTQATRQTLTTFYTEEPQPDSTRLTFVKKLCIQGMEDSTDTAYKSAMRREGRFALQMKDLEFSPNCLPPTPAEDLKPGDWLRVCVSGFVPAQDKIWDFQKCAKLVVDLHDPSDKYRKWCAVPVSAFIGNRDWSIWFAGQPGRWGEASMFVQIPPEYAPTHPLKAYVWNPDRQSILIDDLRVELWRK